jgi:predicted dehydrogenase
VRLGILGCGHVSDQYFEGIARSELLEIVACADLDLARAEEKAALHRVPRAGAPEQLITDPEVELVVNLTPPLAHADASLSSIAAGKHVWSEKPLASSLDAARQVLEAADEAGVRIGCAPDTFLGGSIQTAIKLIDDGWIGQPVSGVAFVSEHGYEHFHPAVQSFYEPGGGPALDLGPYYVTALVAMLGPVARVTSFARATFPERVAQLGPRRGERIPVRVPTHFTGALEFDSGALVGVLMSWDVWATNLPQPPMSRTTPPPRFKITSRRPSWVSVSQSSSSQACARVLCRSPAGTVATSGSSPALASAPITTGPYSSATVSSVITATCASPTSSSSCFTVCSNVRVTTIGYESWRPARPSTGVPGAGSSMASSVWTRSRLRSSAGIARSLEPAPPSRDRSID